jgi:type IV pilus assembly protein PilB
MTLSAARPVPDALSAVQQRLEVELLLGEHVLGPTELEQADRKALHACPSIQPERWKELGCLPLSRQGERLRVAVPTYWSAEQRQTLTHEVGADGLEAELRMGLKSEIDRVLARHVDERRAEIEQTLQPEGASAQSPSALEAPTAQPIGQGRSSQPVERGSESDQPSLLKDLTLTVPPEETQEEDQFMNLEASISASNASPVVSLVNRILIKALESDSSDIHVEPEENWLQIRFRQDGVLHPIERLPKNLTPAVTSRMKIMADLDIAERRMPQDGRSRRTFKGRPIELRVSTLPGRWGEKVVLRLLDSGATQLGLETLITDPSSLALVRSMGARPFGMILVTGPTGSGKTTTLYSLLS